MNKLIDEMRREENVWDRPLNDLLKRAADALARLQWQPIETAPKDGTKIIAWWEGSIGIISWRDSAWRSFDALSMHGWIWNSTHWMPVPPSPEEED